MPRITRRLEFDAGHRVLNHESKCAHLHGHRYVAEITVEAPELDSLGRVIDFSVVKSVIGGWIDTFWDHNFICHPEDPVAEIHKQRGYAMSLVDGKGHVVMLSRDATSFFGSEKPPFIMPVDMPNPTAENMVVVLAGTAARLLDPYGIRVHSVRLYETPNCWADHIHEGKDLQNYGYSHFEQPAGGSEGSSQERVPGSSSSVGNDPR